MWKICSHRPSSQHQQQQLKNTSWSISRCTIRHVATSQGQEDPTSQRSTCKVFFVSCPHVRCHVEMLSQQKAKHDVFLRVIKNIPINIATPTAWKPTNVFMCGAWHHHVRFSSSPVLDSCSTELHPVPRPRKLPTCYCVQPGLHLTYGRTCSTSFHDKLNQ